MLSYSQRAQFALNPLGKNLLHLMDEKQTNMAVSADVVTAAELLAIAESCGPHMAVLKTHIDILRDFSPKVIEELLRIAAKHRFYIFEDRKFADIGNTVRLQYKEGIYHISQWADIINAHIIPGPSIIESLKEVGLPLGRALLLIAEMSSQGNLATGHYTKKCVEWASAHAEFVIGFITQHQLSKEPAFIHMTPGVQLQKGQDSQGQRYVTPHEVIFENGCDMIIVGRGIIASKEMPLEAQKYREAAWHAYQLRLQSSV